MASKISIIGLTGGIGSGKSTAAKILAELGAFVIDADKIGHQVYEPGTVGWRKVVDAFGHEIVGGDGRIDRKRLGEMVFADPKALDQLNSIVHPLIAESILRQVKEARDAAKCPAIVIEAALMTESGWKSLADEVWLITASPETILERLETSRGMDPETARTRMKFQLSEEERRSAATIVIDNDGTLAELREKLARQWARVSSS